MSKQRISRLAERVLIVFAVAALSYAGFSYGHAYAHQSYLDAMLSTGLLPFPGPGSSTPVGEGMPLAKLEIPRLGMSVVVLEGVEDSTLKLGAGHVPGTALPGRSGNTGVAAHRDTYFRALREIRNKDVVRLTTSEGVFDYAVEWTQVVKPTAVEVLESTGGTALTLVTCYPFSFIGSAPDRFVVRATLVE